MNNRLPWAFPHFETRTNFAVEAKKIEPVLFFFFSFIFFLWGMLQSQKYLQVCNSL